VATEAIHISRVDVQILMSVKKPKLKEATIVGKGMIVRISQETLGVNPTKTKD